MNMDNMTGMVSTIQNNRVPWLTCSFVAIFMLIVDLTEMNVIHTTEKVFKQEMNIKDNIDIEIHQYKKSFRM